MNKQYKQFNFFGSVVVMAESQKAAERQLLKVMTKNAIGCSFSLSPPQAPVSGLEGIEILCGGDCQGECTSVDEDGCCSTCGGDPVVPLYEVAARLNQSPPTAELLPLPNKWREDELSQLEREVATANALVLLETGSVKQEDGWLLMEGATRGVQALRHEPDIRYLELRGLLERHPDNPDLVRLKPAPPQEGE